MDYSESDDLRTWMPWAPVMRHRLRLTLATHLCTCGHYAIGHDLTVPLQIGACLSVENFSCPCPEFSAAPGQRCEET
jgi:hypothetical protein